MMDDFIIRKKISNNGTSEKYFGDIVIYELLNLDDIGMPADSRVFVSKRHKNDMPCVFTFGVRDESYKEAVSRRDGRDVIVSDHLTIIGNDTHALLMGLDGGQHNLIRTEITTDGKGKFVKLSVIAEADRVLEPGEEITLDAVSFTFTDNVNKAVMKWARGKTEGTVVKTRRCPAVFCTWYYYGQTVNYDDCLVNLGKIREKQLAFDVFQIDDGWEKKVGEWTPNDKFPPLKEISEKIKSFGLVPGLWTSPFIAEKDAEIWALHNDWILRDGKEKPCIFNVNDTDFYIFDISVEETWTYFENLYRNLSENEGFTYHKLDFTRAPLTACGADRKNKHMSFTECYRKAFEHIRKGLGDSFLLVCGGLYDPLIGIADAQRTGRDVYSIYSDPVHGKNKTLPYTIKQSLLRYYMNCFWYNDPDSLMIRKNRTEERGGRLSLGLLTDSEAELAAASQIFSGGIVSATEPLDKIPDDRLRLYSYILPKSDADVEVTDFFVSQYYPHIIRIRKVNEIYYAYINFTGKKEVITVTSEDISCPDGTGEYSVVDFFTGNVYGTVDSTSGSITLTVGRHSCALLKLVKEG